MKIDNQTGRKIQISLVNRNGDIIEILNIQSNDECFFLEQLYDRECTMVIR